MSRIMRALAVAAIVPLLAGCSLFAGGPTGSQGGVTVEQLDQAYRELDGIQQGLAEVLGVTWQDPTAIGPVPCGSGDGQVEMWLARPASSDRPIGETLQLAGDYLVTQGLTLDAEGFPEMQDGELFADRVTGRRAGGSFFVEVRAATNGVVQVSGVSDCLPGVWTDEWTPPSA